MATFLLTLIVMFFSYPFFVWFMYNMIPSLQQALPKWKTIGIILGFCWILTAVLLSILLTVFI